MKILSLEDLDLGTDGEELANWVEAKVGDREFLVAEDFYDMEGELIEQACADLGWYSTPHEGGFTVNWDCGSLIRFVATAECQPKNADTWFDGWNEGLELHAENRDSAQAWLLDQCTKAGTDSDPYYNDYAPLAKCDEIIVTNPHSGSDVWVTESEAQERFSDCLRTFATSDEQNSCGNTEGLEAMWLFDRAHGNTRLSTIWFS